MTSAAEALAVCERGLKLRNAAPDTLRVVLSEGRRLLGIVEKSAAEVTAEDVRAYLADVSRRGRARATLAAAVVRLRIFFRELVTAGVVTTNPTAGLPTGHRGTEPQLTLSTDEVKRLMLAALKVPCWGCQAPELLRALALRDRAVVELLYGVGVRRSEAGWSRVGDLRLSEPSIFVRRAKRGENRVLPLPEASVDSLRRYLTEGRPVLVERAWKSSENYLLLSWSGGPLLATGVWQVVRRVARRSGIKATPHAFRRGLATHMVRAGINVEAVRQVLGHQNLETTALYARLDREDLRRAVQRLDNP